MLRKITLFAFFIASLIAGELKPNVCVTTFALYDIVKNVAKDSVNIENVVPFGVSLHTYEPTPKDIIKIQKSDLLLFSGAGLEPWIKGFGGHTKSVDISKVVSLRELGHDEHDEHHHHDHSGVDPHYWLDIDNMILATKKIRDELISLNPKSKEFYTKNADVYIELLKSVDNEYKNILSSCRLDTIVVNHDAFSYLSLRYGFKTLPLSGLSPEAEPNAKKIIKLVEAIKNSKVKVIFSENFTSDKAMKNIAKESNTKSDILQPMGNISANEAKAGVGYADIMRANLLKIKEALECR